MTRIGLVAFGFLLVACKHSKPAQDPVPGDDPKDTAACEALDEAGCGARTDCAPFMGNQLEGDCSLPSAFAGCGSADRACGDAFTFTHDPAGNGWWFSDTCLPDGWVNEPGPDGTSETPPAC